MVLGGPNWGRKYKLAAQASGSRHEFTRLRVELVLNRQSCGTMENNQLLLYFDGHPNDGLASKDNVAVNELT